MTTTIDPAKLSRLRWHCRRGMRELDVLFMDWFETHYVKADSVTQADFEALLELQDPVILAYLTGRDTPEREDIARAIQQLTSAHS